jgi:hypothetical protein
MKLIQNRRARGDSTAAGLVDGVGATIPREWIAHASVLSPEACLLALTWV